MSDLLNDLNPAQQAAVTHGEGPALVLAGAGSGKTTVLTRRACWLIENQQARPDQVLLVTFTNKAAQEMCSRITRLTGQQLPYAGTFHRLSARILRQHGRGIGLTTDYMIYDADDQTLLVKELYKQHGWSQQVKPQAARAIISAAKNDLLTPDEYAQKAENETEHFVAKVYKLYQRALQQSNAVDFDDLLLKSIQLLELQPNVREYYQTQFKHVLVDEYQDTNKAQYALTALWAAPQHNLFVVGDFCQSIYSWRGADFRNMLELKNDFSNYAEYKLEQNYRSTQTILDAASGVIKHNQLHPTLQLWTERAEQQPIQLIEAATSTGEAELIAQWLREQYQGDLNDVAILYRTNAQSRSFEEVFIREQIPYRLIGGTKFYERKEIKDVLSYARLVLNEEDTVSRQRLAKLGKRKLDAYQLWLSQEKKRLEEEEPLTAQPEPVQDYQHPLLKLPPQQLLQLLIKQTGYLDRYDEKLEEDQQRIDNVIELLTMAAQFSTLAELLETIALLEETDTRRAAIVSDNAQAVNMMSLHAAKGLEFDTVFLVGLEEGLLPHSRSLFDPVQLEEERRLCYVGITRAKQTIILSYARYRMQYGSSTTSIPSRFLSEIPGELFGASKRNASLGMPAYKSTTRDERGRRLVSDDDLDALLHGELDVSAFLDR